MVDAKLASSAVHARIPGEAGTSIVSSLRWDMLASCMARKYEDCIRTKYYELLEHWYLAGRFPCGRVGSVPDDFENAFDVGKLAVL